MPTELFAVNNGLLHVAGGLALLPHDPTFFNLSAVAYDYRPTADCPRWRQFLNELSRDSASVQLLREWFGYCLLPDTSQEKILAISGPPRSGKSTITRILRALLGSRNVACPSIRSLSGPFGIWGLLDKLVAIVPDAMLLRPCPALEELLKSISGEDAVDIQRKGLPPLTGVRLSTRIVIVSNDPPQFCDPSGAGPANYVASYPSQFLRRGGCKSHKHAPARIARDLELGHQRMGTVIFKGLL